MILKMIYRRYKGYYSYNKIEKNLDNYFFLDDTIY